MQPLFLRFALLVFSASLVFSSDTFSQSGAAVPTAIPSDVQKAYELSDYSRAARLGAQAIVEDPGNHALRLIIANSLAWSGRTDAAMVQYEKLFGSPQETSAKIGLANLLRWRGKAHEAEPIYDAVIAREPSNKEALEGKKLGDRNLRPQVSKGLSFARDSSGFTRIESSTDYSRFSDDRSIRWGIGYVLGKDRESSALIPLSKSAEKYASIRGHIQALAWPSAPRLDLSVADGFNKTRLYGLVSLDLVPDTVGVRSGFVNWGRRAFNGGAQAAYLFARQAGFYFNSESSLGSIRSRVDAYRISDGNFVWDAEATIAPAWQPLPFALTWYAGVAAKAADRTEALYWSPSSTYGLGLLGVKRSWYFERGDLSMGLQAGIKLTDEARNNVSFSANGKYWLTESLAIGFDAYANSAPRPSEYSQKTLNINLLRLW